MTTATLPLRPFSKRPSAEEWAPSPFKKLTVQAHRDAARGHAKARHPSAWRG